ncbi:hypothetical protein B9Z55_004927 [Caenorhabditis nigoni]|uniref:Uncharacterized protein n=1 Tax=Caenorhabditis nigoni TaxID=1611254 RepID=A0A2G5UYQ9_9PELO|nr:hypothetical protein B9Z55_004927 [Caenorhabditis nigoni]
MFFSSLFQLAVKSVAQHIHNEKIPLDFHLNTKSSNAVVRELLKLDPENIRKLEKYRKQLSKLTELDLRKCRIDERVVLNLKNFKLNSLEFGELHLLKREFPDPTNIYGIDVVSLLEEAVNTDSREIMIHLGFTGQEEAFMSGWEKKISKLFPYLQSIKIIFKRFNERCPFSSFCVSFPNLRVLDISYARDLSSLNGIKNLRNLQKLVMCNAGIRNFHGYQELSELKNLKVLEVSGEDRVRVIRNLLTAEVRMESLEFLDCSMTPVEDHELKTFVERHPKLKTVVAITTGCDELYIPTIDLLKFNSPHSTVKSLEYALTNESNVLADRCMKYIYQKLNTNHEQLNDSEIRVFLNVLCYVLRVAKDEWAKPWAVHCFFESNFFETERFFTTFSLEIPGIVELIFKSLNNSKRQLNYFSLLSILKIFKRIVDFSRCGRVLQDRLLSFIMEKTVELQCPYPENIREVTSILIEANRFMSVDQYSKMCNNKKVIKGLFDFAHKLITFDPSSYQQIMEIIVSHLTRATENTLNYLVSNCQVVEKWFKYVMIISQSPNNTSLKDRLQIELRLIKVINPNVRDEKAEALMACSILSLLLAKNLFDDQEYLNNIIEEFNESWSRSNILDCPNVTGVLNAILNSKHSKDESICFGLKLMSTSINATDFVTKEYWNWIRATSERIRNNQKLAKTTRESASAVLYEMVMSDTRWKS